MSRKTEFAQSWWAQRWIRLLERFGWSARLNRGRSYARHGNVIDIDVQPGLVRAKVQGSRKQPYRVEIGLKPISRGDWNKVIGLLRRKAIYAARLLSGEMPRDIEDIFSQAGVSLFPKSGEELIMSCTCPDWANPCKHVAAVYLLLGEQFDADPFLIFRLRGKDKRQIISMLRAHRSSGAGVGAAGQKPKRKAKPKRAEKLIPLEAQLDRFWTGDERLDDFRVNVRAPEIDAAPVKRLGTPGFWHGKHDFGELFAQAYREITEAALAIVSEG